VPAWPRSRSRSGGGPPELNDARDLLGSYLLRGPQEILIGLLRLLLFLVALVLVLLLKLWECLTWLFHTQTLFPEKTEKDCGTLPEVLVRRPDPSIYSQSFLMAQGLPVTWNNPDIWVAPAANPGQIEPDSFHLLADTDYIVTVQAHNAATDAAIGVRVRLVFREWSFNSPDFTPVELDASGNEVIRSVDIAPLGSAITQFNWHTPPVAAGQEQHFCLQARLSHPQDINPANNVGQENTNVHSANPGFVEPGEVARIDVPLFNTARRERTIGFRYDRYEIAEDDEVELTLERTVVRARLPLSDRIAHALPTVEPREVTRPPRQPEPEPIPLGATAPPRREPSKALLGGVRFSSPKSRFSMVRTRATGFDQLRSLILDRDYSLPPGMDVTVTTDAPQLALAPAQSLLATFEVKVPDDAVPGTRIPMNIVAVDEDGTLVGGVTVFFDVKP
jgi:hypothetical protein